MAGSAFVHLRAKPEKPGELFFGSESDGYNHLYLAKLQPPGRPNCRAGREIEPKADSELFDKCVDHCIDQRQLAGRMGKMGIRTTRLS